MTHDEIRGLLAFHAAGTLAGAERREVEAHVTACADCAREVEQWRALRDAERAAEPPAGNAFALTRALASIDDSESRARLGWWRLTPNPARWLLAAQLALLIGLGLYALRAKPEFTTLSGPPSATPRVLVAFQPAATEEQIRSLLLSLDAQIAAGPNTLGQYSIAVPGDAEALAARIQRESIVRFAARQLP